MYSVSEFGSMIADERRTDAYVKALQEAVHPDSVVLDIGTGTGVFAILACRFGARHVYAVEPAEAIHVARRIAQENGVADRITFIQDLSTRITLPEQADVIISDLHGVLPYYQFHIPSIVDARTRHLAQCGRLIPQQDTIYASVVTASKQYDETVQPWEQNKYDLRMNAARHVVMNLWGRGNSKPDDFLVEPQRCVTLDYRTLTSADLTANLAWTVERGGIAHGFNAWFDTQVADGICISNAPGQPELVYGHAFFPWTHPVVLMPGDVVKIKLQATLTADDYLWRWDTRVVDAAKTECVKADFKQSTFHSVVLSAAQLAKKTATYIASLSEEGEIDRFILGHMDGKTCLSEIAEALQKQFPHQFPDANEALGRVGKVSEHYSR